MPSKKQSNTAKRPLEDGQGNSQERRVKSAAIAKRAKATAEWNVTSRYSLVYTSRYEPANSSEYVLDLNFPEDGPIASLFAFFHFPNLDKLHGVMRLCPADVLDSAREILYVPRVFLPEFEAACELSADLKPSK